MAQKLLINITAKIKQNKLFTGVRGKLKGLKDSVFNLRCFYWTWWWSCNKINSWHK